MANPRRLGFACTAPQHRRRPGVGARRTEGVQEHHRSPSRRTLCSRTGLGGVPLVRRGITHQFSRVGRTRYAEALSLCTDAHAAVGRRVRATPATPGAPAVAPGAGSRPGKRARPPGRLLAGLIPPAASTLTEDAASLRCSTAASSTAVTGDSSCLQGCFSGGVRLNPMRS
jgi:hypothetical protein